MNNTPLDRCSTGHGASVDFYWISFNEFVMFRRKTEARGCTEDFTLR